SCILSIVSISFLLAFFDQIQGYKLWVVPAMDFLQYYGISNCNTMEFPIAILWNFNLQLSVFLSYNKHRSVILLPYYHVFGICSYLTEWTIEHTILKNTNLCSKTYLHFGNVDMELD
ncbi:MAG: hypothetical protein WA131_12985, partial [Desulfitobacteriaceae bacterium]